MKSLKIIVLLIVATILESCGLVTHKMYEGKKLPRDQVAFVQTKDGSGGIDLGYPDLSFYIRKIDGKTIADNIFQEKRRLEILPGEHTMTVKPLVIDQEMTLRFNVEAGRRYEVHCINLKTVKKDVSVGILGLVFSEELLWTAVIIDEMEMFVFTSEAIEKMNSELLPSEIKAKLQDWNGKRFESRSDFEEFLKSQSIGTGHNLKGWQEKIERHVRKLNIVSKKI